MHEKSVLQAGFCSEIIEKKEEWCIIEFIYHTLKELKHERLNLRVLVHHTLPKRN